MKKRKLIVCLIIILLIVLFVTKSYGFSQIWSTAKSWITPDGTSTGLHDGDINSTISEISSILFGIGIFTFVIGGVTFGIRYMVVGGIEEKAEIKKQMAVYFLGGAIVVGALGIWKFFISFAEGLY